MAEQTDRGIPLSKINPRYLHSNSTSHTWPFGAIAELIDNAYDPDVSAKQFWIDKTQIKTVDCLTFADNGNGLSYDKMHKMLSFGFSDKQDMKNHLAVGLYGNGFKSGSMRLGKDAIVFSKTKDAMCVGMLSQTYLEETGASHVVVPIVSFRYVGPNMQLQPAPEHSASQQDILKYSLFHSESELEAELLAITGHGTMATTGTRIIIWNLRKTKTGEIEFDFDTDKYDIRIPPTVSDTNQESYKRPERVMESPPESDFSLRAYCSILYLTPRMQIIVRGQKVKTQLVSKTLAYTRKDNYKPNFLKKRVVITFGYNTKSKDHYGIMMYHKNRLIKAYQRVGCQLKANTNGVGVIGVIECNFLKPTHNKQDFDYTDEYRKTISNVAGKLEEYWKEIRHKKKQEDPNCSVPLEDTIKRPDQNWVECDKCLKFRKLPDGIDPDKLPEKWFCMMNPDPQYRSCEVPQEEEDTDDEATYTKTYKQDERNSKSQAEKKKQEMEEERKKEEMEKEERLAKLEREKDKLQRKHKRLIRQLRKSARLEATPSGSSVLSHTDLSPSSKGRPSTPSSTPSIKRKQRAGLDGAEAKQARYGHSPGSEAATTLPPAAAAWPAPTEDIHSDNKQDDVIIDETRSTPKPKAPAFDISQVKTEQTSDVESFDATVSEVPRTRTSPATPTPGALSPERVELSSAIQAETSVVISEKNEEVKNTVHDGEESGMEDAELQRIDMDISQSQDGDEGRVAVLHPQEPTPVDNAFLAKAQQQQDQLMELMEKTALERDAYQTQVQQLIVRVKNLEQNVLELTQELVKKEQNHQACQTHYPEGKGDYKSLQQQIEQLQKERDALAEEKRQWEERSKGEGNSSRSPQKDHKEGAASFSAQVNAADDELALQMDLLFRELDQRNVERDELKTKLASLEVERSALVSQVEQMQKELEEQKEAAMGWGHGEAGVGCQTHSSPDPHGKETKHKDCHHIAAPQRSCESCADVPDSSHWVVVKPEVSTEKSISTYSLSSPAGSYECSESGLRWSCAAPVTLQYCFTDWHLLADEVARMQYRPAGPSMDINFISGELEEIHLPHFLCLGGTQSYLKDAVKVLQKGESGVFLETCELSRFHARVVNPSFSLFGVFYSLKSLMFPRKEKEREKQIEIHADVQMYLSSTSPLTFRVYLLPLDAHLRQLLEDQEKGFKGKRLAKLPPGRPLQMHESYPLKVDGETVGGPTPEELDLRESSEVAPNFSEVRISEAADFKMELLSPVDKQKVWQAHIWSSECS